MNKSVSFFVLFDFYKKICYNIYRKNKEKEIDKLWEIVEETFQPILEHQ